LTLSAYLACVVCKAAHAVLRLLKRGGTAIPGRLALKICPDIIGILAEKLEAIVVTGTNGKTTSARMLENGLILAGYEVCANRSGANLIGGIAATYILNTDILGRPKCRKLVIECDEAASKKAVPQIRPKVMLITNLFNDQPDRYGSVTVPRDSIAEGLKASPDTIVCINADSPMAASIGERLKNRRVYFGLSCGSSSAPESGESDLCPMCGRKMQYSRVSYANLGTYICNACGFKRNNTDVTVRETVDDGFIVSFEGGQSYCRPALRGLYNIYNSVGAITALVSAGVPAMTAIKAVEGFERGFGRMERLDIGAQDAEMILIKNAAASDQTLDYIKSVGGNKSIALVINNRTADGTDISWLDAADFGRLRRIRGLQSVYVCGDCADTVKNRLGRENITCIICDSYGKLIRKLEKENNRIFILPTYTAMMDLRHLIVKKTGGREFWE